MKVSVGSGKYVSNGIEDIRGPIRIPPEILPLGHARQHQNGFQPRLRPDEDVGVHAVADHVGVFGVGVDGAEGGAHDEGVGLADVVGLDAGGGGDEGGDGAGGGDEAVVGGACDVGVGCDEAGAGGDKAGGLGDALEAVGEGLAEDDVFGGLVGDDVAGVVEGGGEPGFAEDEGAAAGVLRGEELRGGYGGGIDGGGGHIEADPLEADVEVALGVEGVVGEDEELGAGVAHALDEFIGAGYDLGAADEDAVHIADVVFGHASPLDFGLHSKVTLDAIRVSNAHLDMIFLPEACVWV